MANGSGYDFGAAFGRLTAVLEDTTDLTVEGQSAQLDRSARRQLVRRIERGLSEASNVLKEIDAAI